MPRSEPRLRERESFLYIPRWTGRCFPFSSFSPHAHKTTSIPGSPNSSLMLNFFLSLRRNKAGPTVPEEDIQSRKNGSGRTWATLPLVRSNKSRGRRRGGISRLEMRRDAVCAGVFNKLLLFPSCLPTDPQYGDSAITEHWVSVCVRVWRGVGGFPPPFLFFPDEKRCNYISACWSESSNNKP